MSAKHHPPVAVCTKCGKTTHSVEAINQQCSARHDQKRCKCVFGSALSNGDWLECNDCHGTGRKEEKRCDSCQSDGWRYVRKR